MNELIQRIIDNDKLPTPPAVAARLLELMSSAEPDVGEITKALGADPGLSAKLINYCNSPIVGSRRSIASLQQAIMVMGMRSTRLLSLSFSIMETKTDSGFDHDSFWRHSLATAIATKFVYNREGMNGDEGLLLGLVLNVGQIGIGNTHPELIAKHCSEDAAVLGMTSKEEIEALGATRYHIGGMMLQKWNFPESMIEAVTGFSPDGITARSKLLIVSQAMGRLLLSSEATLADITEARDLAIRHCNMDGDDFDLLFDELINEWKGYETIFSYDNIPFDSIKQLEQSAHESILRISLGMDKELDLIALERQQLEKTMMVDALTNLKNRRAYDTETPGIVSTTRQRGGGLGMIVIDIDHFKQFNDEHGHSTGDTVLKEVGQCLASNCRDYDTVYRYGGEEFVVLVQNCKYEHLPSIANRLRTAVESLCVDSLSVTASLGACWSHATHFNNLDELFNAADKNLYLAKKRGRNTCVIDEYRKKLHSSNHSLELA